MAGQVFAYIVHKNGVADDTAMELLAKSEDHGVVESAALAFLADLAVAEHGPDQRPHLAVVREQ